MITCTNSNSIKWKYEEANVNIQKFGSISDNITKCKNNNFCGNLKLSFKILDLLSIVWLSSKGYLSKLELRSKCKSLKILKKQTSLILLTIIVKCYWKSTCNKTKFFSNYV